ncbi:MAG: hypothetical protein ACE14U_02115 [Candidatus Velamenicoccus archaeovorus]
MRWWRLAALLVLGGFGGAGFSFGETGLSVTTDKKEYRPREIVTIRLTNGSPESIFSHLGSQTPVFAIEGVEMKNVQGGWDSLSAWCRPPFCVYDMDAPAELRPQESVSWAWDPWIYTGGTHERVRPAAGTYRLRISYRAPATPPINQGPWLSVVSNEFTVR